MFNDLETAIKSLKMDDGDKVLVKVLINDRFKIASVERVKRSFFITFKPESYDMYCSRRRVKGNSFKKVMNVEVWAYENEDFMKRFDGDPIELNIIPQPVKSYTGLL